MMCGHGVTQRFATEDDRGEQLEWCHNCGSIRFHAYDADRQGWRVDEWIAPIARTDTQPALDNPETDPPPSGDSGDTLELTLEDLVDEPQGAA